jgi:tRNA-dihydrouridine synthase B
MKLGRYEIENPLILGPMAGVTDWAFRTICAELGANITVTEMVSSRALVYQDKKSRSLLRKNPGSLCGAQIFGNDPAIMAEAAVLVASGVLDGVAPAAIDLNFGCPVRKIAGNGEGSALMKEPRQIERITAAVAAASPIPVTVKLRAGWDRDRRNAPECARAAEAGGASLIAVHGRTRADFYGGEADLKIISEVREAVSLPIVGNGDIRDALSAERMLRETGCHGLMVGRGAVGNPFIFRELSCLMRGEALPPSPTMQERIDVALRQLRLAIEEKGEEFAVLESRKQIAAYISGIRGAADIRRRIHGKSTYEGIREELAQLAEADPL